MRIWEELDVDEQVEVDVVDELAVVEVMYDDDEVEVELLEIERTDVIVGITIIDELDELDYVDIDEVDDEVELETDEVLLMVEPLEVVIDGEFDVMLLTVVDDEVELMLIGDEMGLDE